MALSHRRRGTDGRVPFLDSPANERDAAFSPDGKWIAYTSDVSGRNEIYIRSVLKEKAEVTPVSSGGGAGPRLETSRPIYSRIRVRRSGFRTWSQLPKVTLHF